VDYFGEKNASDCGVCDVCLERRKKLLNHAMESDIEKTILKLLKIKPQTIDNLTDNIKGYKSPEIITVVRLLLDEAKVQTDGRLLLLPD
jgi:ATP-dependent DNA helicase RecQ